MYFSVQGNADVKITRDDKSMIVWMKILYDL